MSIPLANPLELVTTGRCALSLVVVMSSLQLPAFAAATLFTEVTVRVYDSTGATDAERRPSLAVAASIVSAAAVDLVWKTCTGPASPSDARRAPACETPLAPGELAVRIIRADAVADGSRRGLPLGDAMINSQTGTGVLATIYIDRVNWMAEQTGTDARALLGRAIAHELGHLLMATGAHGANGLMRPVWSAAEIRRHQIDDWIFRPREIAAIKARTLALLQAPRATRSRHQRTVRGRVQSCRRGGGSRPASDQVAGAMPASARRVDWRVGARRRNPAHDGIQAA